MHKTASCHEVQVCFCSALRRLAAVWVLMLACCAGAEAASRAQSWRIDETQTWIGFKIEAVGFPTTRGHFTHYQEQIAHRFRPSDEKLHHFYCQNRLRLISARHRSTNS